MGTRDRTIEISSPAKEDSRLNIVAAVIDAASKTSESYIGLETQDGVILHQSGPRPTNPRNISIVNAPDGSELRLEGDLPGDQLDAVGRLVYQALATHFELTEAKEDLGRSRQELSLLFEFSQSVCRVNSVEDVVERFLFDVVDVLDADEGTLLAIDETTGDLKIVCHHGSSLQTIKDFRLPLGSGIAGKVAEDGLPRIVNDTSLDPDYVPGVNPVKNLICVPIRMDGDITGVVTINDRRDGEPFEPSHLKLLSSLAQLGEVGLENARLFEQVRGLLFEVVDGLVKIMEANAPHTVGHSRRIARLSYSLGRSIGLDNRTLERLYLSALVHDLGAPPAPQKGPVVPWSDQPVGAADDPDSELIAAGILSKSSRLAEALPGLGEHQERYDGFGYPNGIQGDDISLQGRIIAVAHAFDSAINAALASKRLTPLDALTELKSGAGTLFDPDVVDAFEVVFEKLRLEGWVPPTGEDTPWQSAGQPDLGIDE